MLERHGADARYCVVKNHGRGSDFSWFEKAPVHKSATQESQFDALFPETPRANAVAPAQLPRVVDVLEAIAEAVSLAPTEGRRAEAVTLLTHLLQVYGMPLPKYLEWVQVPEVRLQKAVARIRLVC